MPVQITADPNQSQIQNDIGIGAAQVAPKPDLGYLDKLADINAKNRQTQQLRQQKQQENILKALDTTSQGKIWNADVPYIAKQQQSLRDFLETDNNASKIAKGDIDAQMKFNAMKDNLHMAVNQSVIKNSDMLELNKEIQKSPGGINDYYEGAQEELRKHYAQPTPEQLADPNYTPPVVDHTAFRKRLAPGTIESHLNTIKGADVKSGYTYADPNDPSKQVTVSEDEYPAELAKEKVANLVHNNDAYFYDISQRLKKDADKEQYRLKDDKGNPIPGDAGLDVIKYAEDKYAPQITRAKQRVVHETAAKIGVLSPADITSGSDSKSVYSLEDESTGESKSQTSQGEWSFKKAIPLKGVPISTDDSYNKNGLHVTEPGVINGTTSHVRNLYTYAGTTTLMPDAVANKLINSGNGKKVGIVPFATIVSEEKERIFDAKGFNKANDDYKKLKAQWDNLGEDEQKKTPEPEVPEKSKYYSEGKNPQQITKPVKSLSGSMDVKPFLADAAKKEAALHSGSGAVAKPASTTTTPAAKTEKRYLVGGKPYKESALIKQGYDLSKLQEVK